VLLIDIQGFIHSGKESIEDSLAQAIKEVEAKHKALDIEAFHRQLDDKSGVYYAVYDEKHTLMYSTVPENKQTVAFEISQKELDTEKEKESTIVRSTEDSLVTARRFPISTAGGECTAFSYTFKNSTGMYQRGELRVFDKTGAENTFLRHYPMFGTTFKEQIGVDLSGIEKGNMPIMLLGEKGTGKEQIAAYLYTIGKFSHHPYYVIDCDIMSEKGWATLFYGSKSCLTEKNVTIYFRHLDLLAPQTLRKLENFIQDSALYVRCRIIFSIDTTPGAKISEEMVEFINTLGLASIQLKPLRKRTAELTQLIGLYLNTLDFDLGKEVIGLTPEAEKVMAEYQWPDNLTQLGRILTDLVLHSSNPYISESEVNAALEKEKSLLTTQTALSSVLDLSKKLDEIEKDIVMAVLLKTKGNQSAAAKHLGISRTTLWRMIK